VGGIYPKAAARALVSRLPLAFLQQGYKTKPILLAFDWHLQNEPNLSEDVVANFC
jgi:hypothetical protein